MEHLNDKQTKLVKNFTKLVEKIAENNKRNTEKQIINLINNLFETNTFYDFKNTFYYLYKENLLYDEDGEPYEKNTC